MGPYDNDYSGELGSTENFEAAVANYLSGMGADMPVGLGFDGGVSEAESTAIGALTALGYDPDTALGAVRTAKKVAAQTGASMQQALNATVRKYIDQAVSGRVNAAMQSRAAGTNTLAPNLSAAEAFKYEGSILVATITGASIAAAGSATYETTLDKPAVIRELRFNAEGVNLTGFTAGGNFPWVALQFPMYLGHFTPGCESYKVRANPFPTKTTFKATFQNVGSGAVIPILEFWGTASA